MVDMRYVAVGGLVAIAGAYLLLSGDDMPPAGGVSPGGYVAGDIPPSGPSYYFPPEPAPVFPAPAAPFDWEELFAGGAEFFDTPSLPMPDTEPTLSQIPKKVTTVNGGFGGGGVGGRKDTPEPAGGLLSSLSNFLTGAPTLTGGLFTLPMSIGMQAGKKVAAGVMAPDMPVVDTSRWKGEPGVVYPGEGLGPKAAPVIPALSADTKKNVTVFKNGNGNGGGMSEQVSDFLHGGSGGTARRTGTTSSGGAVYTHDSGARSVVSGGQIVGGTSRALSASDVARMPASQREALGY